MSACATGCGTETGPSICAGCWQLWLMSGEYRRACAIGDDENARHAAERYDVAQMDFCNRTRAERTVRDNEGSRAE